MVSFVGEAESVLIKILGVYLIILLPFVVFATIKLIQVSKQRERTRRCLHCGYVGRMKSVLSYRRSQRTMMLLLFAGIIPGLIYFSSRSGKYKCRRCRKATRNISVVASSPDEVVTPEKEG